MGIYEILFLFNEVLQFYFWIESFHAVEFENA